MEKKAEEGHSNRIATVNPAPVVSSSSPTNSTNKMLAVKSPETVVLNIGGQRYETLKSNFLNHFPNSRLWRLIHAVEAQADLEEILKHCDR